MRRLLLIPLLALAAGSAHATGLFGAGAYVGAGVMRANPSDILGTGLDVHNTSFKALAGLRFSLLGAEVDYCHLGSASRSLGALGSPRQRSCLRRLSMAHTNGAHVVSLDVIFNIL